jgi:peptide/nickel transport system substrate-binding protein
MRLPASLRPFRVLCGAVAVALSAGLLAACGGSSPGTSGGSAATAVLALGGGQVPDQIVPLGTSGQFTVANMQGFQWLMYRPLIWYGGQPGNEFGLYEAESLADPPVYSDGDTVVTIKLKDYKWSNGQPVTSRDAQFDYNLAKANKSNLGLYTPGAYPDNVKAFTIVSPTEFKLTLTRAYNPLWFTSNELGNITPLPQSVWDKTSASGKVGNYDTSNAGAVAVYKFLMSQGGAVNTYSTNPMWKVVDGPWRLKSFSTRGDIVFVPNKSYSGPVKAKLSEFIERPFTSNTTEFNSILANTGLTVGYVPTADLNQVKSLQRQGYRPYKGLVYGLNDIELNYNNTPDGPLFRQLYIRQALQHLINQPQDVQYALHGAGNPSYGPVPLNPPSPYATPYEKSNPYPFSTDVAKQLLTAHGWTVKPGGTDTCSRPGSGPTDCGAGIKAGQQLSMKVLYPSEDPEFETMMDNWASAARSAGVTLTLSSAEFNTVTSDIEPCKAGTAACNWQVGTWGGWTMNQYPTGQGIFTTSTTGAPPPVGTQIDKMVNATEYSANKSAFSSYENYVAKELPTLFMPWEQGSNYVVAKNLQGFTADEDNPFGMLYPEDWSFSG